MARLITDLIPALAFPCLRCARPRLFLSRWPGGGLDKYLSRVVTELLPLVSRRYNTSTDASRVAFGGGSFAGICALYAAMAYPHVFGRVLAESPSLWVAEGRFLQDLAAHTGALPER